MLDLLRVGVGEVVVEDLADGGADELAHDGVGAAHLAFVFEFELAGDAGQGGVDVADARHRQLFAVERARRSALETTSSMVEMGRRWLTPLRLSTLLSSRAEKATCSIDLAEIVRNLRSWCEPRSRPGFLRGDGDAFFEGLRIVGADLRADAVFERSDDFAARGVVLGVGAEDESDIEVEAHGIALNLHVAFLHDVEERTWILPARSGSSLMAKMPRLARGSRP